MFRKNVNSTLVFLIEMTMILCVVTEPVPADVKVLNDAQLDYLSSILCSNLEIYMSTSMDCKDRFRGPTNDSLPTTVVVKCQTAGTVTFQIPPSNNWQVVILIPATTDENVNFYDIEFVLLEPKKEYDRISTIGRRNYTIWNTEFSEGGTPLTWRGGDKLPLYSGSSRPEHKDYNITAKFFFTVINNTLLLNGFFAWNASGDGDLCFDVLDTCAEPGHFEIWPNQPPEILIKGLSVDKMCKFRLLGHYGSKTLYYNTPSCYDPIKCSSDSLKYRNPRKIDLHAIARDNYTWTVRVNWTRPVIQPKRYNLTLRADNVTSITVPGNVTEAVFQDIVGEGLFNVSIYSIIDNAAHISKIGLFPPYRTVDDEVGSGLGVGAAAALCAGAAAAALLAACCWRREHARDAAPTYPFAPEEKSSKEGDVESMGLESDIAEDSWEVRSDRLLLYEVIGEGAFGVVRRGTMAPGGKEVAVKMLKDFPTIEEIRSFRSEMELMKSVGVHPHIVSLVGCSSGRKPLIIAEYCSRGDLLSYLRRSWDIIVSRRSAKYYNNNIETSDYRNDLFKCKMQCENSKLVVNQMYDMQGMGEKELTALDLLSFCRQIAMGMEFLSSNRVVHRDLAARNILVTSDKTLKIADFGLSRDVYEENQYKMKGNGKMPIKWMALESLTRRVYTTQSDVWSFGVVVWEVVTMGGSPYSGVPAARLPRLLRAGYRMPCPDNCSPHLYELMRSCWHAEARLRPSFAQLHAALDRLLLAASAHHYLSLEPDAVDAPPPPPPTTHKYFSMLIRGKRNWSRGESYERPLKAPQSNHYSSPPVMYRPQPV